METLVESDGAWQEKKTVILYCFLTGFPSWTFANTMTIKQMQNKESIHRCMCVCAQPLCHVWLCYPMDCNPSDSSAHGIFKARILECVAIFSSRGSSQPSDWTLSPALQADFFYHWATGEVLCIGRWLQQFVLLEGRWK